MTFLPDPAGTAQSAGIPPSAGVALPEIVSALSFALDLTEGAVLGHALRSCVLGMRLAEAIQLPQEMLAPLFYALQLKDIGCSSNATRMTQIIGGDDRAMKASTKLEDWRKPSVSRRALKALWKNILPGKSVARRAARLAEIAMNAKSIREDMIQLRCERGAQIVRKLELDESTAEAVRGLDEHWDGGGYPDGMQGENIPLLSRICSVAQNLDVFAVEDGIEAAMEVLRRRSGTWFDPRLVQAAEQLHVSGKLWRYCRPGCSVDVTRGAVMAMHPGKAVELGPERIDMICQAFADVVDAKSPFTFRHSLGVAEVAEALAVEMGFPAERRRLVRRAALLHDLGKLGISNTILDKTGPLTPQERAVVEEHPFLSFTILDRISSFHELAVIAGEHHERLDGTGYPMGLSGDQLCMESRLLAVADSFSALAEARPYREPVAVAEILTILGALVPEKLDSTCFAALKAVAEGWEGALPAIFTAPPTGEVCLPRQTWSGVSPAVRPAVVSAA